MKSLDHLVLASLHIGNKIAAKAVLGEQRLLLKSKQFHCYLLY